MIRTAIINKNLASLNSMRWRSIIGGLTPQFRTYDRLLQQKRKSLKRIHIGNPCWGSSGDTWKKAHFKRVHTAKSERGQLMSIADFSWLLLSYHYPSSTVHKMWSLQSCFWSIHIPWPTRTNLQSNAQSLWEPGPKNYAEDISNSSLTTTQMKELHFFETLWYNASGPSLDRITAYWSETT